MRRMADSTNAANLPTGWDLYAGYVDGKFQSYGPACARFGASKCVPIAVFSTTNNGIVGDCEAGDMTPQTVVHWVEMRRTAGVDPTVYCSVAAWPTVIASFNDAKVPLPHFWIAAYPGNGQQLYAGSIAHQYADVNNLYDASVVADYWPGVDPVPAPTPPPAPSVLPTEGDDTLITSQVIGNVIHVWGVVNDEAFHWWQTVGGNQPVNGKPQPNWYAEAMPAPS